MNEKELNGNPHGPLKTNPAVPAAASFKQTTTKSGKIRARWTMKIVFNDGNVFTYRSDLLHAFYTSSKKGYNVNEIEAVILKFTSIRGLTESAQIFDNSLPQNEDTILHFVAGKIMLNKLPRMSNGKSFAL